ncbi:DUF305 domain-containing protein [Altererythrobacter sp. SALINAS58]|uniref:DUF305 domain-containing protein n=1 Tax=Alteripontixanthobacter muriae TaxID=2705546 RepID=UPI001574FC7A|nr:DUF305 domain-containing protein [Alteripontixanthobacter muriae]NTZ42916.1 DUF305 domain-containing protein [Alteripontixanthobacter muriae]
MTIRRFSTRNRALACLTASIGALAALLAAAPVQAQSAAPIVQPGAPGQAVRALTPAQAIALADTRYSPADIAFMRNMILHHRQAVEMAALIGERTNNPDIVALGGRITASQADELAFMREWLGERGVAVPAEGAAMRHDAAGHAAMGHTEMAGIGMSGMATPEQMAQLRAAQGTVFDRQFLTLMISHHEGAVDMVEDLLKQPGSAYDPRLFEFTSDVTNDQTTEIERMTAALASLSSDPRANLAAGFRDAGEAASNMRLIAALPKPEGFFDPANPAGLSLPKKAAEGAENTAEAEGSEGERVEEESKTEFSERSPLLNFANTDLAFSGDILVAGNYHGFNIYNLGSDKLPTLVSSVVCPGGQGDVSIVGDLLIMSVEQTRGRVDCGLQGVAEDVSAERFRGLRIFDISDRSRPRQVGQVQTCRGSHTHSVVQQDSESLLVYVSGTSSIRDEEELAGCIGNVPGDERTALFRIDVVEIPLANPGNARIIDSPAVFADEATGRLAGLWGGGDHGEDTQETNRTDHCHDITVYPARNIAAGACSGNGIIFDISDPRKPKRIDEVVDEGFAYWHSATFNNDGTKVLFTDEWGGGSRPRCRARDPMNWGADAIYDIVDGKLEFRSLYKLPAPQGETENCVAHNGSIIPVPGRDIFLQAWYQGGISVIDFTDSANPVEIAYFDRGPISAEQAVLGGYWSAYWYGGRIYGTEITRGLDVLALEPSEFLSEAEIAAAALANQGGVFNPQQQFPVSWPANPIVARAYLDQMERNGSLGGARLAALRGMLDRAENRLGSGASDGGLAADLISAASTLPSTGSRNAALADTLRQIAATL